MKKKMKSISIVLILSVLAFAGITTITQIKLRNEIKQMDDKLASYYEQLNEYQEKNEALSQRLQDENESDLFEDYARKEYGYVYPDEHVYADSDR